jgi:tRNA threonylcarbamoyladenosine biosynthesis protein TsaE
MTAAKKRIQTVSHSPEATYILGQTIGRCLKKGDIIALSGDLGSGKTCFTQGLAKGLDVLAGYNVTSPTFTLMNEYPGRLRLYHLDVYRLSGPRDIEEIGYEDYFYGSGVIVIEWAEKVEQLVPDYGIWIFFRHLEENTREIVISGPEERLESFPAIPMELKEEEH